MEKPLIVTSRIWLNRWQSRHRSAQDSNVCVSLAYGPEAAASLDLRPRRPGRKSLAQGLTAAILAEPMSPGVFASLRIPEAKVTHEWAEGKDVDFAGALFELKFSREERLSDAEIEDLARRLQRRMGAALEPVAGPPWASAAQWGGQAGGFHPTGGDAGLFMGYQVPTISSGSGWARAEDFSGWQGFVQRVVEIQGLNAAASQAECGGPALPKPRL